MVLPEALAALPNTNVRFKGTFKGSAPFTVKWFKDDSELMTGPTCFTGLEGLSCFLDLYSVAVSQSGIYSCQVSNEAGSVRCSADLTVKGWVWIFFLYCFFLIIISHLNHSQEVDRDTFPIFYLCASIFFHSSFIVHLSATTCLSLFVLHSSSIAASTLRGVCLYIVPAFRPPSCLSSLTVCHQLLTSRLAIAPSSVSQPFTKSLNCSVQLTCICFGFPEPPEFLLKLPATKFVKQGEALRLECKVTGTAPLKMTWYRHDSKIVDSGKYRMSFVDSVAVLELPAARFDDDGVYTCEAQNDAGSISCSTTLTVKGQPP